MSESNVTRIDRYTGTEIFSIFGQLEEVVAQGMIEEGKAKRIPLSEFPPAAICPEVHVNQEGQPAKFAILINKRLVHEFDARVAQLRM